MASLPPPPPPGPPAGWYPDPSGQAGYLWWDGTRWTDQRAAPPPPPAPSAVREWGPQVRTPAGVFVLADWGRRFAGYVLDLVVVGVPLLFVDLFIGFAALVSASFGTTGQSVAPGAEVALVVVNAVVPFAYAFLFLRFGGRTLGMMATNIRAIDRASGGPLTTAQTARRVLAYFFLVSVWSALGLVLVFSASGSGWPVAFTYLGVVGALTTGLWPIWNPSNQTLQDKAANTVVVNGWPRR